MQNIAKIREQYERYKRELREAERKADTRRKILYGIALLKALEAEAVKPDYVTQLLDSYITSKSDRAFLNLPPLEDTAPISNDNGTEHHNEHHKQPQHQNNW